MLAWYDEPPELLARAVASAAVVADRVVAVDGGYRLRPGAAACSPAGQADAIRAAAREAGLAVDVVVPAAVWEGQVEKRAWMLERACRDADWVLPLDADWVLLGDRETVRGELAAGDDVAVFELNLWTPWDETRPLHEVAATGWHFNLANRLLVIPALMRVLPEMRMEAHHWWYSGLWQGERRALWGFEDVYPEAPRRPCSLEIEHRCFDRDLGRIDANREFCAARDEQVRLAGAEA